MKKIGLISMALVLAMGILGVGYAAWTDSVEITGTVNTGSVDIDIIETSSTFVYKVPGAPDIGDGLETVVHHVIGATDPAPPATGSLIASAVTVNTSTAPDADTATWTFTGLFPCIDFAADVLVKYNGSVPGKIQTSQYAPGAGNSQAETDILVALLTLGGMTYPNQPYNSPLGGQFGAWLLVLKTYDGLTSTDLSATPVLIPYEVGYQLHQNDVLKLIMIVHLPQDETLDLLVAEFGPTLLYTFADGSQINLDVLYQENLMGQAGMDFVYTLEVIQWNEY